MGTTEGATLLDVQRCGTSWQLAGSLDAAGGRTLLHAVEQSGDDVRIDGSQLQRIDGAGLTALAVARLQCRAGGHTFAVTEVATDALRDLRVGGRVGGRFLELFAAPTASVAPPRRDGTPSCDEPDRGAHRAFPFHLRRRHHGTER
jgi:anti-anti-sigma regulatory factor